MCSVKSSDYATFPQRKQYFITFTYSHSIFIFSHSPVGGTGSGTGTGTGSEGMESKGSCWDWAFCFHFMVMPPRSFSPPPLSSTRSLKCRFIRISYVSILNRLSMFEFYCIFYALHWPHSALRPLRPPTSHPDCFIPFFVLFLPTSSRVALPMSAGYIKFRKLYAKSGFLTPSPSQPDSGLTLLNTNIFLVGDNCVSFFWTLAVCVCVCVPVLTTSLEQSLWLSRTTSAGPSALPKWIRTCVYPWP